MQSFKPQNPINIVLWYELRNIELLTICIFLLRLWAWLHSFKSLFWKSLKWIYLEKSLASVVCITYQPYIPPFCRSICFLIDSCRQFCKIRVQDPPFSFNYSFCGAKLPFPLISFDGQIENVFTSILALDIVFMFIKFWLVSYICLLFTQCSLPPLGMSLSYTKLKI